MNKKTRPSPFQNLKKPKPRQINLDPMGLVRTYFLDEEKQLPFVVEAIEQDINTEHWLSGQRAFVLEKLYRHGAVLFRGFPIQDSTAFEAAAATLCPDLYGDYGDLPKAEGRIYDVTPYPPEGTILFHNESSHMARWPMKQFFFCRTPAARGGATPIVDCRALYRQLDPQIIELLARKGLRYVRNFIQGVDVSWRDFFKTENRAEVEAACRRNGMVFRWKHRDDLMTHQQSRAVARHPVTGEWVFFNQIQLHHISCLQEELRQAMLSMFTPENLPRNVYLGDGGVLSDEVVAELQRLAWENAASFAWRSGDLLMVDNMLVAHARKPYQPPRKMFVAMGELFHQDQLIQEV